MKILIVNIKFLGDLIVSTPAVRSLRRTYPDAEIVMTVRKGLEGVFSSNPNINGIISFDPVLKGNSSVSKFIEGIKFIRKIRSEKFDVVISLHPGDRVTLWAWFSGAKIRIAPGKQKLSCLFNRKVNVEENSISYLDYYNQIVSAFGVKIDSRTTELYIRPEDEIWAGEYLKVNNIDSGRCIIGMHPGASEPTKIWKPENFIELISKLILHPEIFIIVFEGPQDKEACQLIRERLISYRSISYCSEDFSKATAVIKKCDLLLTHDTGTRHIAVAVGTPVLALFPEDNDKYWNFYGEEVKHQIIYGRRNIPLSGSGGRPFLDGIAVSDVYKKIGSALDLW